ncbi:PAS domain S-box-containing protein [Thermosporothrix hazakensis]|uniref:histidine kinase n=1 Tax=Thermosporothrix hazakensis TaxID=644383 RepID=A0A326U6R0_THEHA|nr:sensor histidine kinase [Thermosporothrix hazakensis]PZW30493.1 PAS domain S-box-containing protein [Thermosporothrix hazakensis]GCE49353.1 hypothetical protein KTH_42220 [Thermosporothrix hazakensis]
MAEVQQHQTDMLHTPAIVNALLHDCSAIVDYRTLLDSLPRRLTSLLHCRCVLLYQRIEDTLQFVAGSFDDKPGWSAALLTVAHINPLSLTSNTPEACAWREGHIIFVPATQPTLLAVPLVYRHHRIGVLVAIRGATFEESEQEQRTLPSIWSAEEVQIVGALSGVIALLLENSRLLERDQERMRELTLLNTINTRLHSTLNAPERLHNLVLQQAKNISTADVCVLLTAPDQQDDASWLSPLMREALFRLFQKNHSAEPLLLEQPGTPQTAALLSYLPGTIKTFFAVPLLSQHGEAPHPDKNRVQEPLRYPRLQGILAGGFYRPWKIRKGELALLCVLANQAGAILENSHLLLEVIEARNEARKLLRQVLDDRRFKELILESIPSGLITTDANGVITSFNRAAKTILGYHSREVIGQPLDHILDLRHFIPNPELELSRTGEHPALGSEQSTGPIKTGSRGTLQTRDRHERSILLDVNIQRLHNTQGGTLITFTDITLLQRLEEEKRRLDRLATLGEMAANVAHEVRNPLASIKTSMQLMLEDLNESPTIDDMQDLQGSASVVLKEIERLDAIVRDLLLFAKPRQLQRTPCYLPEISDRVLHALQSQCEAAQITVQRAYEQVPLLRVDSGQIEQVLFNLYLNALQAMQDGGTLTVRCQQRSAEEVWRESQEQASNLTMSGLLRPGSSIPPHAAFWVDLSVHDTGRGITPEQLERIFQPFFTTKAHGIGLGLAITRRLVEDHGGYIKVESHPGKGTTMTVRLPGIPEAETRPEQGSIRGKL